jgi:hypothetical protein
MPPKAAREVISSLRFSGALTADFRRFYSARLSDELERGDYGELLDLINWLPADSAYMTIRRLRDDVKKARMLMGWTIRDDMLWELLNRTSTHIFVTSQLFAERKKEPPPDMDNPTADESKKKPPKRRVGSATAIARAFMVGQE